MNDLTKGPVSGHILRFSMFIAMSTVFQTLYFIADLYFVGRLGKEAIAGVALAGNLTMVVLALTQSLGVGATSLIAQTIGRKDHEQAELAFNQSLVLASLVGLAFGVVAFAARGAYCRSLAADAESAALGMRYLNWFIPALCLQFPLVAMGSALRGLGDLKVPTAIQVSTVILNIVLAPTLMFGWITGHPLGVSGAALASLIAITFGLVASIAYIQRPSSPLNFQTKDWPPQPRLWWRMLVVGLPAGGEFALISVYITVVYVIIKPFGVAAQAGFGIGARVMQSLFLPAVAIAFAAAPVAGQNYGARLGSRVRETFASAAVMTAIVMLVITALCHIAPESMVRFFNNDPAVVAFGTEYLRIISWNFLATGVVFVSSSIFQGMGNTLPPLGSSSMRIVLFAIPAYLLSLQPGFQMRHVWYLSVGSVFVQLCTNLWLLRREFNRKLSFEPAPQPIAALGTEGL